MKKSKGKDPHVKVKKSLKKAEIASFFNKTASPKGKSDQTPEEKKRAQSSNYFKFLSRGGPQHPGSKEVPKGASDCLNGLTFVTTGVLDSFERDDIVAIVTKYGGRVTTSVSRKTSYLLVGDEPGESKIKKAKELNIPRMTEDEFLEFIRKSNPNQPATSNSQFFGVRDDEVEEGVEVKMETEEEEPKPKPIPATPSKSTRSSSKRSRAELDEIGDSESDPFPPSKTAKVKIEKKVVDVKPETSKRDIKTTGVKQTPAPGLSSAAAKVVSDKPAGLMWVDKYKPTSLKSIVGQVGDKSNASKLMKWLQAWFSYHGKSDEKVKAAWPGLRDPEGKTFKAALLSGPPGIGKTTTAHLCCKEIGYDYFELNASDTRNKKGLHNTLSDSLTSEALTGFKTKSRRHILIMDEVDGMAGNEDRGGVQELIALIKSSRVPILCICNDRNHPKIRSLANYCYDLRFSKPTNEQLKAMIQSICFKEKMKLPADSVQQLIISTDHDVRQILHQLQLIKQSSTPGGSLYNPKKDLRFGPWDVCRKVFSASEHRGMSLHDKNHLFFQDYNIGPLFVQENYLKWTPIAAGGNRHKHMDLIQKSAEALANGDLVENLLRRSNNWSLLPTQAIFSSILPGEYMEGNEVSGIEFPRWLGQNSHKNKMSRLLQQLHNHVHLKVSGSLEALNMDYLPYLRRSIVNPLIEGEIEASVNIMQEYSLLREDLESIIEVSIWPGTKNPMESVESKTKAAFTRQVNKEILPYSIVKVTKGRGAKVEEGEDQLEQLEEDDEENPEEEEEEAEDLEKDAMIKIRTSKKKGSDKGEAGPSTSKSKGSSRQSSTKSSSSAGSGRTKSSKKK